MYKIVIRKETICLPPGHPARRLQIKEDYKMPKFYGQNKKRIDPRYFMDEKIEEAVIEPGLTKAGKWPGVSPADRAKDLANQAMQRQISGEIPPWEKSDECGDGFTDASLSEPDYEVLNWILKDLRIGQGRGNMGDRFLSVMSKLGIALKEPQGSSAEEEETGRS